MQAHTDVQMTLVRSRMLELRAEAAHEREASNARAANGGGIRRRLGRGLVAAGTAIARDGLVEDTGEPIARPMPTATRVARPVADACLDRSDGIGCAA